MTTGEKQALANNATGGGNTTDDYSPVEPGTDEGSSPDHPAAVAVVAGGDDKNAPAAGEPGRFEDQESEAAKEQR